MMPDDTTAQGSQDPGAGTAHSGRHCGDDLARKRKGVFRIASSNVGNFSACDANNTELVDVFSFARKHSVDLFSSCEHGLNPRKLCPSKSWNNGMAGQFKQSRSCSS